MGEIVLLEQLFAEAEVCQFESSLFEKDVGRLEVAVENVGFEEGDEGVPHLIEQQQGLIFWNGAFLLDEFCESASLTELVDEEEVSIGL